MKWGVFSLIFILLISVVSASSIFIKDELAEGESGVYPTEDGVYVLKVIMISDKKEEVKFKLNNKEETSSLDVDSGDDFKDKSEVWVRDILVSEGNDEVTFFFYGTGEDVIEAELPEDFYVGDCNFDGICDGDDADLCCYDCGCEDGYRCRKNKCIRSVSCTDNGDCDDSNPCTKDSCNEDKCSYVKTTGCRSGDICLSENTVKTIDGEASYCDDTTWNAQKKKGESCGAAFECSSGECKSDTCYEATQKNIFLILLLIAFVVGLVFYERKHKFIKKLRKKLFFRF